MCGIVGVYDPAGVNLPDRTLLEKMTNTLRHRGPDGFGYFSDDVVSLGHARLAVIDLEHGEQPCKNENGRITVVFNGEIYNHVVLRHELEQCGHHFRSRSDTEVLVHGYEEWGDGLLHRLDGMFAFALWDADRKVFLLARDRFGEKPLYVAEQDGAVFFASEPRALLVHPKISGELDRTGLSLYMALDYIPFPHTAYAAIKKFPPATLWRQDACGVAKHGYWSLPDPSDFQVPRPRRVPAGEREQTFERLFQNSVNDRLVADVPVGIALSGGVDSAAVMYAVARAKEASQISAYTIGFDDARYDESALARKTAAHFGIRHVHRQMRLRDVLEAMDEVLGGLDEPFADQSLLPTYLLSRTMREEVTVALGGDGGDELLGGYPIFRAHRAAALLDRLPRSCVRLVERITPTPSANSYPHSSRFAARRFVRGLAGGLCERQLYWHGGVTTAELTTLFRAEMPPLRGAVEEICRRSDGLLEHPDRRLDPINRSSAFFISTYLVDDILHKVDRASMAVSLEFRSPFLNDAVARFLWSLPSSQKATLFQTKIFLRRFLRGRIPPEVLAAPKRGFGLPLSEWFCNGLGGRMEDVFGSPELGELMDRDEIRRLYQAHRSGHDQRQLLWRLYVLGVFLRNAAHPGM